MPTPLTNDRWGYESSCFVCEQSNLEGLQIPFQLDDDGETVSAAFTLGPQHSGAPTLVHGGLSLAVLDEAQAWACIAVAGKWGLTRTTQASFDGAVFVDHSHRVEATVTAADAERVTTQAVIVDQHGTVVVRSTSSFTVVGEVDKNAESLGLTESQRGLLRD